MKYILKQYDIEAQLIQSKEVGISNIYEVLDAIHYWDTSYSPNKKEVEVWMGSGHYKDEFLSISGESEEEDGFYTGTMYLELTELKYKDDNYFSEESKE